MMLGAWAFVVAVCAPFALQAQNVGKRTGMKLKGENLLVEALNLMTKEALPDLDSGHCKQDEDQRSQTRDAEDAKDQSFAVHYMIRHRRL
jgi:hypothetical protein